MTTDQWRRSLSATASLLVDRSHLSSCAAIIAFIVSREESVT